MVEVDKTEDVQLPKENTTDGKIHRYSKRNLHTARKPDRCRCKLTPKDGSIATLRLPAAVKNLKEEEEE